VVKGGLCGLVSQQTDRGWRRFAKATAECGCLDNKIFDTKIEKQRTYVLGFASVDNQVTPRILVSAILISVLNSNQRYTHNAP